MRRRELLAGAVAAASALVSEPLTGARPVGPETVTGALDATEGYRALITTEVARDSMGPLLRHAGRLRDLAVETPDSSIRDGLLTAHGDALTVAAWVAADGRHLTLARRLAGDALAAADNAGNHDLRACVLAMLGLLVAHQQDDPYGALKLVGKGMDAAKHTSPVTRAYLAAVAAEAHSMTGSRYRTLAALEQADRHLERAQPGDAPSWLRGFVPARMQHYRGACLARVGHARYAATILHDALDRHAPASNNRALIHTDLAVAYARLREPEQACAALTRAAAGVRESRSAMRYERLHAARAYLDAWQHERFVQELDEQLTGVAPTL
jgi:ATP/maltotriose-dependent transcriptional regulator MalT